MPRYIINLFQVNVSLREFNYKMAFSNNGSGHVLRVRCDNGPMCNKNALFSSLEIPLHERGGWLCDTTSRE